MKIAAVGFFLFLPFLVSAQIHKSKLLIPKGSTFAMGTAETIIADTLIMEDSSRLVLNNSRSDNFIRANVAIFGTYCRIDGRGDNGAKGKPGIEGRTPIGPCKIGSHGRSGDAGKDGTAGVNLYLYLEKVIVNGGLVVDISGGNGGDGGEGGLGGGGSPGTVHCNGGDGGNGGSGGKGGDGGRGGILTIGGFDTGIVRSLIDAREILVCAKGGNFGYGGYAGGAGAPGLGPSKKHGKAGLVGRDGILGISGDNGSIQFEQQYGDTEALAPQGRSGPRQDRRPVQRD